MSKTDHPSPAPAPSRERWSRVRAIAESMLDAAPAERPAILDAACAGDAALRAEVEALVRSCESAASSPSFLATPAARLAEPMLEGTLRSALAERYAVEREVGRGGMARVYLARDLRHNRAVAIKVLNPELGAMLGVDRFLAEIEVTASLQHPNLLPLFDSGDAAGLLYYVMPFIEGESLRARIRREGQLPLHDALSLATAIAGALDYAHRRGIVHRDLKPENILLHEGEPLVADFGIALALSKAGGDRLTQAGAPLGTPTYMSPEQAAADRPVDARSDVYSLGCVLYEMLAGDPPHTGGSVQTVMRKVISEPALPIRTLRPSVPAHVERALERALAKVPADRFDSARDFAAALGERSPAAAPGIPGTPAARPRLRDPLVVGLGCVALAGCLVAGWLWSRARDAAPPRTTRFVVGALTTAPVAGTPTITPDGRRLVYAGPAESGRPLYVRALDELQARALPGVENAVSTFVSPDGRWIGYFSADDKLRKVPFDGGTPVVLASAFRFGHARWSATGVIVTDSYGLRGLSWVADSGGALRPLTQPARSGGELSHAAPMVLADGRTVIFTVQRQRGGPAPVSGELAVASMDSRSAGPVPHTLLGVRGGRAIAFVDGWILYTGLDGATIMAVRYDPATRTVSGAPVLVLHERDGNVDGADLAGDGTLVYTRRGATSAPVLVGADGAAERLLGHAVGSFMNPRVSPDGRRIALAGQSPQGSDIWIYDVASRTSTRLTSTGNAYLPTWTPDGRGVVFLSTRSGHDAFWTQRADGSAPPERLLELDGIFYGGMTPDGRTLVFQRRTAGEWEIWSAALAGDRTPRAIMQDAFDDYMPAVSPDGRWLAYASSGTGREEVLVRAFPGPGAPVQVSEGGGREPVWSRDGRRLHYRSGGRVMTAEIASAGGSVTVTARSALAADTFEGGMPHANFDVMPDGRRLLLLANASKAGSETVIVVNWLAELRDSLARAPR